MALAVVTRIPSFVEAQIVVGALRSGGIDAQVFDGNFGQVEAPVIEALGGFRVMAPEDQLADAREVLAALKASPGLGEPDEVKPWGESLSASRQTRARRWRFVWMLAFAVSGLIWLLQMLRS